MTENELYQKLAEITGYIAFIEGEIAEVNKQKEERGDHFQGKRGIFSMLWNKTGHTKAIVLTHMSCEKWNDRKIEFAKEFIALLKAEKVELLRQINEPKVSV